MVEPKQLEDGGVEIVHAHFVHGGFVADFVGGPVVDARLDSTAGEPIGESVGIVVPPRFATLLRDGETAKFTAPDDEG